MPTPPPRLTAGLIAALGFVTAVGPFATDMYLTSFTDIASELGAAASSVQLTLTAFLAGIGVGQLILGPMSDRFGRRRVLLIAIAVFAATGIALVFSPTIEYFVALRLLQGLTGAAGIVICRAIAVDLSTGETAVRALSLIATVVALGPVIAPPVGGIIATVAGWRGVLATLAVISCLMLLVTILVIPESLPPEARHRGGVGTAFRAFGGLLADLRFTALMLAIALAFGAMLSYISASPFVGQTVLRMPPLLYALGFAGGAAALITANLLNARIAPRFGPRRMLRIGISLCLVAASLMTVLVLTGTLAPWSFVLLAFVTTGGAGLTMSNGSALALARTTRRTRGSGAALIGSLQFATGAVVSPIVGLWGEHTALPMALMMLGTAGLSCVVAFAATRR